MTDPLMTDILLRLGGFALAGALGGLAMRALRFGGGAVATGFALAFIPEAAPQEVLATVTAALGLLAAHAAAARKFCAPSALGALAGLGGAGAAALLFATPMLALGLYGAATVALALTPLLRSPPALRAWSAPAALLAGVIGGGLAVGAGGFASVGRQAFGWRPSDVIWIGGAGSVAAAMAYALEGRVGESPTPMLGALDPLAALALAMAAAITAHLTASIPATGWRIAAYAVMALLGLSALARALG